MGFILKANNKERLVGGLDFEVDKRIDINGILDDFFNKIIPETMEKIGEFTAQDARENIDEGKFRKLDEVTIFQRERGVFWEGDGSGFKGQSFEPRITGNN